ncbi:CocE/NonD family hydrolase (plasmid) [Arthrobacter sp. D3-18]
MTTIFVPASDPRSNRDSRYRPLEPLTQLFPAGHKTGRGKPPLTTPITVTRDLPIPLRDGVTIYADVYRPADVTDGIPAIMGWGPYGKGGTGSRLLNGLPQKFGVPRSATSGLEAFEAVDPAYWCSHGYAVVQIDPRGVFNSEGDILFQGADEGRDGHDAVEFIGTREWCNGKVGLAGNSWLAILQWQIAATRPPHLAAIAPWEGASDLYAQAMMRGGIPNTGFASKIRESLYGMNGIEDPVGMLAMHPLKTQYWTDKVANIEAIAAPAYVVASYTNQLHAEGTLEGYSRLTGKKWLRVNNTHEWTDFYDPDNVADLRRFFDHFLCGIDTGWMATPRVRMAVLEPHGSDTVGRAEDEFPPSRVRSKTLFLDAASSSLTTDPGETECMASYELAGGADGQLSFTYTFEEDTELIGKASLTACFEVAGGVDLDVYAYVRKRDARGRIGSHQMIVLPLPAAQRWMPKLHQRGVMAVRFAFYDGPESMLRLSERERAGKGLLDTPSLPLSSGEVVEATMEFWPVAMRWRAGETLELTVSARRLRATELPGIEGMPAQTAERAILHTGGRWPSRLVLPLASAAPSRG